MDDLMAFIRARIGEIETVAKAAASVAGPDWAWKTDVTICDEVTDYVTGAGGAILADTMGGTEDMAPHIACHDPGHELRVTMTMRAILVLDEPMATRLLGAIWIGHPDYRDEWKP